MICLAYFKYQLMINFTCFIFYFIFIFIFILFYFILFLFLFYFFFFFLFLFFFLLYFCIKYYSKSKLLNWCLLFFSRCFTFLKLSFTKTFVYVDLLHDI